MKVFITALVLVCSFFTTSYLSACPQEVVQVQRLRRQPVKRVIHRPVRERVVREKVIRERVIEKQRSYYIAPLCTEKVVVEELSNDCGCSSQQFRQNLRSY